MIFKIMLCNQIISMTYILILILKISFNSFDNINQFSGEIPVTDNIDIEFGHNTFIVGLNYSICQQKENPNQQKQNIPDKNIPHCWNATEDIQINQWILENFKSLQFGINHTCLTDDELSLHCLGDNSKDQSIVPLLFHKSTKLFTLGFYHTCGTTLSMIECWGDDSYGQLNIPDEVRQNAKDILYLTAGAYTTCTKDLDNPLRCWGRNEFLFNRTLSQQLVDMYKGNIFYSFGTSDTICAIIDNKSVFTKSIDCWGRCENSMCEIPVKLSQGNKVISVGHLHICTIAKENLGCWGDNSHGQTTIPLQVHKWAEAVAAGSDYTCALTQNGYTTCWGGNTRVHSHIASFATYISAGGRHSCGMIGGAVSCWGNASFGATEVPTAIVYMTYGIVASWDFTCALMQDNNAECWGLNWLGQTDVPEGVQTGNGVEVLAVGLNHSCALRKGLIGVNQVTCWGGHNEQGQNQIPMQMAGSELIDAGDDFTCVTSHKVFCFGNNSQGQCDPPKFDEIKDLSSGGAHSCVISKILNLNSLNLSCWGGNYFGQSTVPSLPPNSYQNQLSTGAAHTCIIQDLIFERTQSEPKLLCWGMRTSENVQSGNEIGQPVVVQAGFLHDCAVGLLGTFHCWGEDEDGQCMADARMGNGLVQYDDKNIDHQDS